MGAGKFRARAAVNAKIERTAAISTMSALVWRALVETLFTARREQARPRHARSRAGQRDLFQPAFSPENASPRTLAKARTERVERRTCESGDFEKSPLQPIARIFAQAFDIMG
jgi:hypothetical protein